MNVYDFDGTLYAGDSTADFVAFLMKRHPALLLRLPAIGLAFLKLLIRVSTKTQAKETLYSIFQSVKDMPGEVTLFWAAHGHKLKKWYASKKSRMIWLFPLLPSF